VTSTASTAKTHSHEVSKAAFKEPSLSAALRSACTLAWNWSAVAKPNKRRESRKATVTVVVASRLSSSWLAAIERRRLEGGVTTSFEIMSSVSPGMRLNKAATISLSVRSPDVNATDS
jgi:hypothetical protein